MKLSNCQTIRFLGLSITVLILLPLIACSDDAVAPLPTSVPAVAVTPQPASAPMPENTATAASAPARTPTPEPTRILVPTATKAPTPLPQPTSTPILDPQTPPSPNPVGENASNRGGVLNLVSRQPIRHQDVHQDVSAALSTWGPGIAYSRLMRFSNSPGVDLPSLAVECEVCSEWTMIDDTTFEFALRDDVLWQDLHPVNARPLVAGDIAYSYDRQRLDGAPNAALLHIIDSVETPADDLLRITLLAPDADFLSALADGHSKIVAQEAVEMNGDLINGPTIGSGAWTPHEFQSDSAYTFLRNEGYFETDAPLLDRLRINVIPDGDTAYAAFRVHQVDVHRLRLPEWEEFTRQQPDASSLAFKEIGIGLEVGFKTTEPPFDDLRVRQAAMFAMRPNDAIEDIWQGAAYLTQGLPLASADWRLDEDELQVYFDDHQQARALLIAAADTLPIPVVIRVGEFGAEYLMHAERIVDEMRSVGFDPKMELVDRRRFGEQVWLGGDYEMFVGPIAPIGLPNGYLLSVLSSTGAWNTTGHANEKLDALILAQSGEYDKRERQRLALQAQRIALENAYRFMPAAAVSLWAWWHNVQGFEPNFAGSEYSHWERVWLER